MSDARSFWCQEYIDESEAVERFGEERVRNVGKITRSSRKIRSFLFST